MWGQQQRALPWIAHCPILQRTLDNEYWRKQGYKGLPKYTKRERNYRQHYSNKPHMPNGT